jgi:hypothetical protein
MTDGYTSAASEVSRRVSAGFSFFTLAIALPAQAEQKAT